MKKMLSLVMALCVLFSLLPATAQTAFAEEATPTTLAAPAEAATPTAPASGSSILPGAGDGPEAVTALGNALAALPELAAVQAMDQSGDEFGAVYAALGDVQAQLDTLMEGLSAEELTALETQLGAGNMAKYRALYGYFLGLTGTAATYSTGDGELREHMAAVVSYFVDSTANKSSWMDASLFSTEWNEYLEQQFNRATGNLTIKWNTDTGVSAAWKWDGTVATATSMTSAARPDDPNRIPYCADNTYYVYSGQQLRYAMEACQTACKNGTADRNILIKEDIDLNGSAGSQCNWGSIDLRTQATPTSITGEDGKTIYNLRIDLKAMQEKNGSTNGVENQYAALIGRGTVYMTGLTFDHANMASVGTGNETSKQGITGLLGYCVFGAENAVHPVFTDVHMTNSLLVGSSFVGALWGRMNDGSGTAVVTGCSVSDSVFFGNDHVGSLLGSTLDANVDTSYSAGCTVISTGGHSGGLIACGDDTSAKSCFVDANVYGTVMTGVFAGTAGHDSQYYSCFSSGFVEGKKALGGFVGQIGSVNTERVRFVDCYSTALVGLQSNGSYLGGFVGNTNDTSSSSKSVYINCYAAGETGYAGIGMSAAAAEASRTDMIGGFAGGAGNNSLGRLQFAYCFYDKQTTAMREWDYGGRAMGNALCGSGIIQQNVINLPTLAASEPGLNGVLTTDSEKSGSGLTSASPTQKQLTTGGSVTGYKGFGGFRTGADMDTLYTSAGVELARAGWDYSAANHYPELKAFKEADAATWGSPETAALVRAYSLSSTAGVQLDTWEHGYDINTGRLSTATTLADTTYCTVRDLTSGFDLTSTGGSGITWAQLAQPLNTTAQKAVVTIAGAEYSVLSLKYAGSRWFCDELIPGVEWLQVSQTVDGQTATRKLRVIPTASIEAGPSMDVTDVYDHADDVSLFFSTAARMAAGRDLNTNADITTGAFPDVPMTATQTALMENGRAAAPDVDAMNDKFTGVGVGDYMSKAAADNAKGSKLYVYAYRVKGIATGTNAIELGEQVDFTAPDNRAGAAGTYAQQFNGKVPFTNVDELYLVSYVWILADGRALQDAKLVQRASVPFDVTLDVYRGSAAAGNLYTGGTTTYAGIDSIANVTAASMKNSPQSSAHVNAYTDAVAAWTQTYSDDTIKSVTVKLDIAGRLYEETVDNPVVGTDITVSSIAYRIVYRAGGYFTIPETVERVYTLQKTAGGMWYLAFNTNKSITTSYGDSIRLNDVETDIAVEVVMASTHTTPPLTPPVTPSAGNLVVTKAGTPGGVKPGGVITYTITLQNIGGATVWDVKVRDYIPQYTSLVSGSVTNRGVYGSISGKKAVTWNVSSVAPGATVSLAFKVKIDECVPSGAQISNTAYYAENDPTGANAPGDPGKPTNTVVNSGVYGVKTGDTFRLTLYAWLCAAAMLGCAVLVFAPRLRKRK